MGNTKRPTKVYTKTISTAEALGAYFLYGQKHVFISLQCLRSSLNTHIHT